MMDEKGPSLKSREISDVPLEFDLSGLVPLVKQIDKLGVSQ